MKGVVTAAVLIVALMVAIKDGRILRAAGLTGSCTSVAPPGGQTGSWQRCTAGKLEGAPNLSRQGCTVTVKLGRAEYWKCPAEIRSQQGS